MKPEEYIQAAQNIVVQLNQTLELSALRGDTPDTHQNYYLQSIFELQTLQSACRNEGNPLKARSYKKSERAIDIYLQRIREANPYPAAAAPSPYADFKHQVLPPTSAPPSVAPAHTNKKRAGYFFQQASGFATATKSSLANKGWTVAAGFVGLLFIGGLATVVADQNNNDTTPLAALVINPTTDTTTEVNRTTTQTTATPTTEAPTTTTTPTTEATTTTTVPPTTVPPTTAAPTTAAPTTVPPTTTAPAPVVSYLNCTDVWNRLGRPIGENEPGFEAKLDHPTRGVIGLGCEFDPRIPR